MSEDKQKTSVIYIMFT